MYGSTTARERGRRNVHKARAIVMILLICVAITILLIDREEDSLDNVPQMTTTNMNSNARSTTTNNSTNVSTQTGNGSLARNIPANVPTQNLTNPSLNNQPNSRPISSNLSGKSVPTVAATNGNDSIVFFGNQNPLGNLQNRNLRKQQQAKSQQNSKNSVLIPKKQNQGTAKYHVVQRGETLAVIAKKYYNNSQMWKAILKVNQLQNPRRIKEGQRLVLPEEDKRWLQKRKNRLTPQRRSRSRRQYRYVLHSSGDAILKTSYKRKNRHKRNKSRNKKGEFYTVRSGDSLSKIAKRMQIKFTDLLDQNRRNIKNPNVLKPGQRIWIPPMASHRNY